jgi:pimeloyl-ACP methyl ester carboxylesterase
VAALAVREAGPAGAPPVVLLHGVGTSGWMWRRLVEDVGTDLHLLVVDLPGHGESAGRPWVSLDDTVAAVAGLVGDRLPGCRAHLVGLSLGGYVATELAARHAARVASALVSGVNVLPFPRPRLMRVAGRLMAPVMTTTPLLRANARALGVPPEDFAGYAAAARATARGTFLRVGGDLLEYRVPEAAAASATRVLAVAGDREQELIRRSLPLIAGAFPQGAARLVPGAGHAWNGEQPALFAELVRAHVAGTDLPAALREPAAA